MLEQLKRKLNISKDHNLTMWVFISSKVSQNVVEMYIVATNPCSLFSATPTTLRSGMEEMVSSGVVYEDLITNHVKERRLKSNLRRHDSTMMGVITHNPLN